MGVMRPAWETLVVYAQGQLVIIFFIVDFMNAGDKDSALDGTPWLVGKRVVLLQDLDSDLHRQMFGLIKCSFGSRF